MTGWTLLFTIVGVAFLTAQLFRLIELMERPSRRRAACRKTLPTAWTVRLWETLDQKLWTSWRS